MLILSAVALVAALLLSADLLFRKLGEAERPEVARHQIVGVWHGRWKMAELMPSGSVSDKPSGHFALARGAFEQIAKAQGNEEAEATIAVIEGTKVEEWLHLKEDGTYESRGAVSVTSGEITFPFSIVSTGAWRLEGDALTIIWDELRVEAEVPDVPGPGEDAVREREARDAARKTELDGMLKRAEELIAGGLTPEEEAEYNDLRDRVNRHAEEGWDLLRVDMMPALLMINMAHEEAKPIAVALQNLLREKSEQRGRVVNVSTTQLETQFDGNPLKYQRFERPSGHDRLELLLTLESPIGEDQGGFATRVALGASHALVTQWYWAQEDDPQARRDAEVVVYDLETGTQVRRLTVLGEKTLGSQMAAEGSIALLGTHGGGEEDNGRVYAFDLRSGEFISTLTAPETDPLTAASGFGSAIALDGELAVIGAHRYDDLDGGEDAGTAFVVDVLLGQVIQQLRPPGAGYLPEDIFGIDVAVTEGVVAVGALGHDVPHEDAGAVYLFREGMHEMLSAHDSVSALMFGHTLAADGSKLVVGAAVGVDAADDTRPAAYVFDLDTRRQLWKFTSDETASESFTSFADVVDVSGSVALVTAAFEDVAGIKDAGAVYLFDLRTGQRIAKLVAPFPTADAAFGISADLEGHTLIVASRHSGGRAYVYKLREPLE